MNDGNGDDDGDEEGGEDGDGPGGGKPPAPSFVLHVSTGLSLPSGNSVSPTRDEFMGHLTFDSKNCLSISVTGSYPRVIFIAKVSKKQVIKRPQISDQQSLTLHRPFPEPAVTDKNKKRRKREEKNK